MLACFLSFLARADRSTLDETVLDCGGGGSSPPLAMFAERGYVCTGIDIAERQVESARAYAEERGLPMTFDVGDMRALPYPDASFSYVYEIESMCHLTKAETRRAIAEMTRVLKPGGYLFAHFMSDELWPITGEEVGPGEYRVEEDGEIVVHSFFTDIEVEEVLSNLDIAWKQKRFAYHARSSHALERGDWNRWYDASWTEFTREAWEAAYDERDHYVYVAWEVIAQKRQ